MRNHLLIFPLILLLVLTACNSATPVASSETVRSTNTSSNSGSTETEPQGSAANDLLRTDKQGAVEVKVTPRNLENPGNMLTFDVVLDTHSMDLSMDISSLAILTTDTGESIQPSIWDAPRGGHHVAGALSFPASVNGRPLLEGVSSLTLKIKDLDALERTFTWGLSN